MSFTIILHAHVVYCPNCGRSFVSPKGSFACKTISCPVCSCEVLR